MNLLDMRTIIFSYLITDIICVWFIVLLWRQNRNRYTGMALWVVDFVLQAAALALIVLRGAIPDWISMILSNTMVIGGGNPGFRGAGTFRREKGPADPQLPATDAFHLRPKLFRPGPAQPRSKNS